MSEEKAKAVIQAHRWRVFKLMSDMSKEIMSRGNFHDQSKLEEYELPYHAKMIDEFEKHPFGTEGYDNAKKGLGPANEHHLKHNRHHPEHHSNGIGGMNLIDLIELLVDWKAATLNHPTSLGNMKTSMELGIKRYNISPQLAQIMYNTVKDCNLG